MSRKKYTFDLNFAIIVPRLLKMMNLSRYNELAEILKISPQAVSNFKKRGIFPANLLVKIATENRLSVDEILELEIGGSGSVRDFSEIPYAERGKSAMEDEFQKVMLQIKRSWVRSAFGEIAKNLVAWQMNSDNMFPTINRNDLLLIDTRVDKIDGSGVYAFIQDEKIMIRRILERLDGQLDVVNENLSYKDFNKVVKNMNIEPELKILGRIVFVGKTL